MELMMKKRICIMTVFLPRENIFFLEEWLKYHIVVGFNHFYLYNNMGSQTLKGLKGKNNNLEVNGKNKHGHDVYALLKHKSDDEVQQDLQKILDPFIKNGYVTHIPWQPRDSNGNIMYAQGQAMIDYTEKYSQNDDWVSIIDMDEFIFPIKHDSVQKLVKQFEQDGITYITMPHACFPSRFDSNSQPVKEVLKLFKRADFIAHDFGYKTIIKSDTLMVGGYGNMHNPPVYQKLTKSTKAKGLVRFNHYRYNEVARNYAHSLIGREVRWDLVDDSIMRFYDKVRHFEIKNYLQTVDDYKPKQNKNWQLHWLDDQPMLFSKFHEGLHLLNPVAGFIWTCCDGKTEVGAIREALQDVFAENQEDVTKDLSNILKLCQENELLI